MYEAVYLPTARKQLMDAALYIAGMIYGILLFVILGGLKLRRCGG